VVGPWVDVIGLLEHVLPKFGVDWEYLKESEMGDVEGNTYPSHTTIELREDVYLEACDDNGRARFTVAHEFGHLFLEHKPVYSRRSGPHEIYEDSEWQANQFAAEFLMPVELVRQYCSGPHDIMTVFGVSWEAADLRWRKLKKERLL